MWQGWDVLIWPQLARVYRILGQKLCISWEMPISKTLHFVGMPISKTLHFVISGLASMRLLWYNLCRNKENYVKTEDLRQTS
jgi:hypothetical protein